MVTQDLLLEHIDSWTARQQKAEQEQTERYGPRYAEYRQQYELALAARKARDAPLQQLRELEELDQLLQVRGPNLTMEGAAGVAGLAAILRGCRVMTTLLM